MFWTSLSLLCAAVVGSSSALAQSEQATSDAQTLYQAALTAKRAQEPRRALCLMERARATLPNAAFSFNIAQLQRELGMCSEARQNYQAFLDQERAPARRSEAENALAELAHCDTAHSEPEQRCDEWVEAALPTMPTPANETSIPVSAAITPAHVAQSTTPTAQKPTPLTAAPPRRRAVPAYLPWIFAGAGVISWGVAGYQLTRVAAAERDLEHARDMWGPEQTARERDGRAAETLFWVLGGVGTLALAGALVLVLVDRDDDPP